MAEVFGYSEVVQQRVAGMPKRLPSWQRRRLDFHYIVCTAEEVKHFGEHHELGLFTERQYRTAPFDSGVDTRFDPSTVISRGLYVGLRPL